MAGMPSFDIPVGINAEKLIPKLRIASDVLRAATIATEGVTEILKEFTTSLDNAIADLDIEERKK